jgi:uncharacterized membrane protein YtjA (UPF0391 family)
MLKYAIIFLVLTLVAAIAGFWLAVEAIAGVAKLLFYAFVIACVYFFFRHFTSRRV